MATRVRQPGFNLRAKLNELDVKRGTAGLKVLAAETYSDAQKALGVERRNLIVNGAFQVWQRGTSFTALETYGADRWTSWANLPVNMSQHADGGLSFSSTTSGGERLIEYRFEGVDSDNMVGKHMTISIDMGEATAGGRLYYFVYGRNTGGTWVWNTSPQELKMNQRNIQTFYVPNNLDIDKVRIRFTTSPSFDDDTWHIKHVQMEYGKVATDPEQIPFAEELARCQRYYYRFWSTGGASRIALSGNYSGSVGIVYPTMPLPVPMRDQPSIAYSNLSAFRLEDYNSNNYVPSSIVYNAITKTKRGVGSEYDVTALTLGVASNATAGGNLLLRGTYDVDYIEFDAEMATTDR